MAKNKISEYSSTAANNTDVANINIAEGCSPSNINNAVRAVMSHLKNFQDGSSGDSFTSSGTITSSGTLAVTGNFTLDGASGTTGQVIVSQGSGNTPIWGSGFPTGGIIMWSGTIATIPSGWYLCDGTNGTPDLRNKFVIAANADDGGVAKTSVTGTASQSGGSKDLVVPAHTHTGTASVSERYLDTVRYVRQPPSPAEVTGIVDVSMTNDGNFTTLYNIGRDDGGGRGMAFKTNVRNATGSFTTNSTGSSATNANLPPYFALAFIMKG